MKITGLDLKAFGPFTERKIDFASKSPGLHIIYGPNEAGKSSSLRALKALLYGFPERTADNFKHANKQLLIGGTLRGGEGGELSFFRRKKRKADLLDEDGNPMDAGTLAAFLRGIELPLFESLFGIDHKTLVAGGEEILAQKGEVGRALFAAGTGVSSLKKIIDSLDSETATLFKAQGSTQQISRAIKEFREQKRIVKEESLLPGKWKEHKERLEDLQKQHAELEEENKSKSAEVTRLERLRRVIPELAELEELQRQAAELSDAVILPADFAEQLQAVEQEMRDITTQIEKDKARLEKLQSKADSVTTNVSILDYSELIEDLYQRLGEYRKGMTDRVRLDGMRIQNRKAAAAIIEGIRQDLTLAQADRLRPVLTKRKTIQNLNSLYEAVVSRVAQAAKREDEAVAALEVFHERISVLPVARDGRALNASVRMARNAGDIDGQVRELAREIDGSRRGCETELKRMGLWSGSIGQLPELALPLAETVRLFEDAYSDLEKEERQLTKDLKRLEQELADRTREFKETAYRGELFTEKDLQESRDRRQKGWSIIKKGWLDGADVTLETEQYDPERELHEAYERSVDTADRIADRLRTEADRVSKAASLSAAVESLREEVAQVLEKLEGLGVRQEDLRKKWSVLWEKTAITPLSPKEMQAWLVEIDKLRFKVQEIINREREKEDKSEIQRKCRSALVAALKGLGESADFPGGELGPVLSFAESIIEVIDSDRAKREKAAGERELAVKALEGAKREHREAVEAKREWQQKWDDAVSVLGFAHRVSPGEALDIVESISECFDKIEKAREFQSRIDGIDRDVALFQENVETVVEKAAPDLVEQDSEQAVLQLYKILGRAKKDDEVCKNAQEDMDVLKIDLSEGRGKLRSLEEQMGELLLIAKCRNRAGLATVMQESAERQRLNEAISTAESSLAKVSEGVSLDEMKKQAEEVSVDELPGRISSLQYQIREEIIPRIQDVLKSIGEENRNLQLMDGRGRAAEAAAQMAEIGARIQTLVEQYVKKRLASEILKAEIERYREEHQDPVLKLASTYFSELTLGSFAGLRTDMSDKGTPVIIGIRPDESRVPVDGMSDGTCDQLYLALRLATLQMRLETSDPMPFIVDDILINFDDERSRATLTLLADLSKKNQVILFTHHLRVVEEAKGLDSDADIIIHELAA